VKDDNLVVCLGKLNGNGHKTRLNLVAKYMKQQSVDKTSNGECFPYKIYLGHIKGVRP
jgi:hypothetical protein